MNEKSCITPLGLGVLLTLLVGATGLVVLVRPDGGEQTEGETLARLRRQGVIRIGYANEAPYGYIDTATGEITGEAPEIARVILEQLGVERIEPVVTEFGALIPGLKAGRFDLIAAGMYITPTRCRQISFSDPTYQIGEAFAVVAGNPLDLHSYEDVARHPTARLGVVGGAIEHTYAREIGIPEDRIVVFPDNISALTAVWTRRIDASAATSLTIHDLLRKADTDQLERAEPFHDPVIEGKTIRGYGAFGFRKDDQEFLREFNRALEGFIGSEEHLRLTGPFGIIEETLPGDVTARELCESG